MKIYLSGEAMNPNSILQAFLICSNFLNFSRRCETNEIYVDMSL